MLINLTENQPKVLFANKFGGNRTRSISLVKAKAASRGHDVYGTIRLNPADNKNFHNRNSPGNRAAALRTPINLKAPMNRIM
jgi:hypothetical protein